MNELLQKHGCSNVFSVPEGLKELMTDICREVLRQQPERIYEFIANYLAVLLATREHGILSTRILEDLCDCRPSVSRHLIALEFSKEEAEAAAKIIKEEVEKIDFKEGLEKIKEEQLLKMISAKINLMDEEKMVKVCMVARNAYKDYWYRKMLLEESLQKQSDLPWEIAAQHTLEVYKKTRPSFSELTRAAQRIQAIYKGFYFRKKMLKKRDKLTEPKKESTTADKSTQKPVKKQSKRSEQPLEGPKSPQPDISGSREMEFGPIIDIEVKEDDLEKIFAEKEGRKPETAAVTKKASPTVDKEKSSAIDTSRQRQQSRMITAKKDRPLFGSENTDGDGKHGDEDDVST